MVKNLVVISIILSIIQGSRKIKVNAVTKILGTNVNVISCSDVAA
jgi:hypothetical protein